MLQVEKVKQSHASPQHHKSTKTSVGGGSTLSSKKRNLTSNLTFSNSNEITNINDETNSMEDLQFGDGNDTFSSK